MTEPETRSFRHLCSEADLRDAMTDQEFWAHVYPQNEHEPRQPDDQEVDEFDLMARLADPCPECGVLGACSYDSEGRALIHVTTDEAT